MKYMQSTPYKTFVRNLAITGLITTGSSGCSSTNQDLFADSLGIVPDFEIQQPATSNEIKTAVNELTIEDSTARAALGYQSVGTDEAKNKTPKEHLLK